MKKQYMKTELTPEDMIGGEFIGTDAGYKLLADAIVDSAVNDYTLLLAGLIDESTFVTIAGCESFFNSGWFEILSDIDPNRLMDTCRNVAKRLNLVYMVRRQRAGKHLWYIHKVKDKDHRSIDGVTYKKLSDAKEACAAMNGVTVDTYNRMASRWWIYA